MNARDDVVTLVDLLRFRAARTPERMAYTFLRDGVHEDAVLTYAGLDRAARAIAAAIVAEFPRTIPAATPGERAVLIYPPGLEFIAAFFGCLYAGMIPIPAPPPDGARMKRTFPRLLGIMEDSGAQIVMSTDAIYRNALSALGDDQAIRWLCSDTVASDADAEPHRGQVSDVAYLQYTSGSTSTPKGVVLTHANVLADLAMSERVWDYSADSVAVTWMPYFHDYGLVDGLLQPLYSGNPCYVLSPLSFIKRPQRWLEAMSRYGGTHTQAPNFAYELCLHKVTTAQRDALDLSRWKIASNGAEPVRESTMQRFIDYFAPCGFHPLAYSPSYGLAEATLMVSTKTLGQAAIVRHLDAATLERDHRIADIIDSDDLAAARSVVGCGAPPREVTVAIVDPETCRRCAVDEVGEIWVSSPAVAIGYWGREEESRAIFYARLAGEADSAAYLRTGDLGFMQDGELYVTGRLKDLIIIAGVNHYPQDIEWTVQQSHAEFRPDHCAAFSVEEDGEERLVVVAEVNRELPDWQPIFDAVRRAVSETHEMELHAFVVLRKGGILKTSSGKLQRQGCRRAFLEGSLASFAEWRKPQRAVEAVAAPLVDVNRVTQWLMSALATRLEIAAQKIDPHAPFASYGLTSRMGVELVGDLEQWLGVDNLSPTLLWEYPNVVALSRYLSQSPDRAANAEAGASAAADNEPIAIVGMACRFPGANSLQEFWQLLLDKRQTTRELPDGRWRDCGVDLSVGSGSGQLATLRAGFIDDVDRFDAGLFGLGGREAEIMDPQQRLLLETTWEAIEHAGLNIEDLTGSDTGVFVGISTDDYSVLQLGDAQRISAYTGPGKALSIAANRLSYQFDFVGPSMAIDTACSSSLVAIHQASHSLRRGECSLVLAGGVNLLLAPQMSIALSQAGMLAPDGRCKTFDAAANGYVRGEGCGLLVLKRLADAQRDQDTILAVIRGSAINQDGRSNGLTAPNGLAQQRVVQAALAAADVAASEIGLVEAHGTGTALGDPIEVKSLQAVLDVHRSSGQACALGAVKANIGHLEAAAGVAGVIKTVLSLQHGEIPPHPALQSLNPLISLQGSALFVPTERTPWPQGSRRLAGVSSFGFGGANAHLILEAAPNALSEPVGRPMSAQPTILRLNARDAEGLRALAQRWQARLDQDDAQTPEGLAQLCHSARIARAELPQRLAVVANDAASLKAGLDDWLHGRAASPGVAYLAGEAEAQRAPRIGFLFTGQGAQYVGMGRELYRREPLFRRCIDECDAAFREVTGQSLIEVLYAAPNGDEVAEASLAQTELTQPALFAIEYALARVWMNWGVQPVALLGHSIGEYVAACVAGVFSAADGLRLVAERARRMQHAPGDGVMVAAMADESKVRAALQGFEASVAIGVHNAPRNHVLSGERSAVEQVAARLQAQGVETRALRVSHAFHSPLMTPVLAGFAEVVAQVAGKNGFAPPSIPVISNLTGQAIGAELTQPGYWVDHLRSAVNFAAGIQAMRAAGVDAFIEIGPRPTLLALAQQQTDEAEILWLPSLRPQTDDSRQMLESLAALSVKGAKIDWRRFAAGVVRSPLPTYPFQRRRYWLPAVNAVNAVAAASATAPFPGRRIASPLLPHTIFENVYDASRFTLLGEHRVFDQVVVPGAAHLSLLVEAAGNFFAASPCELHDVVFPRALVVPEPGARRVQLLMKASGADPIDFNLISLPLESDEGWEEHANGRLTRLDAAAAGGVESLASLRRQCDRLVSADFYRELWQSAIGLGPRFRWVREVWRDGPYRVLARLQRPQEAHSESYRLHPGMLDSVLQVLVAAIERQADQALVPFSFESFRWWAQVEGEELWSYVARRENEGDANEVVSDVSLFDADGRLLAEARGFRARRIESRNLVRAKANPLEDALYAVEWRRADETAADASGLNGRCLLVGAVRAEVDALAQRLEAQGGVECVRAYTDNAGGMALPLDDASALKAAFADLPGLNGVIYLAADAAAAADIDVSLTSTSRLMHLVQAMLSLPAPTPQLALLTRQAQLVTNASAAPRVDRAALWGLVKGIRLEHPELACQCIDLDGDISTLPSPHLAWIGRRDAPDVALHEGHAWTPSLQRRALAARATPTVRADACYLISGGLGALGLQVAQWLVAQGARALLLLGRRAPNADAAARIAAWREQGVTVQTPAVDVADAQALTQALGAHQGKIAGVFHLAGVLDDGMILQQTREHLRVVLAPKLGGALNLQHALADSSLDFFVAFSSVAALTGSMGQSTYAAANAALDALMAGRRSMGQAGLSLQWGPWAEAGMAAAQAERDRQRFADYGIEPIGVEMAMSLLGRMMADNATPSTLAILPVNWARYLGQLYGGDFPPIYRDVMAERPAAAAVAVVASGLAERLLAEAPASRRALLEQHLRDAVAAVLGLADRQKIAPRQRLFDLGLDSLGAVELRNRLATALGRNLRATLLFDYPTLHALADHIEQDVLGIPAVVEPAAAAPEPENLDHLSDDDLASLLAAELGS